MTSMNEMFSKERDTIFEHEHFASIYECIVCCHNNFNNTHGLEVCFGEYGHSFENMETIPING